MAKLMKRRLKLDWVSILLILGSLLTWGRFPFDTGQQSGEEYLPLIAALVYGCLILFPLLDKSGALAARLDAYMIIVRAGVIAILFKYYAALVYALGLLSEQALQYLFYPHVAIGIALIMIGNHLPQLKPNTFAGVRTPWTLKDPEVWRKTNRFCGYFSMISGVILILSPLLLPVGILYGGLLVFFPIYCIVFIFYSYWLYRRKLAKAA
jgi:uncharacterized membrane protein